MQRHPDPRFIVAAHIFWVAITLARPSLVSGTCVVAIVYPQQHEIILAADGKVSFTGHPEIKKVGCKIVEQPSCIVGLSGIATYPRTGFDLSALARTACTHPGDIRAKADYFENIALAPVTSVLRFLKMNDLTEYRFQTNGEGDFIDAIFCGLQDGHLSILVRGFRVDTKGEMYTIRSEFNEMQERGQAALAGNNSSILAYMTKHADWDRDLKPADAARMFIRQEIKEFPARVAAPIALLQIDKALMRVELQMSVHWIDRGACVSEEKQKQ